jgi:uncharacterized protein
MKNIQKNILPKNLGYFRFRKIDGKVLLTNEVGEFMMLKSGQWDELIKNGFVQDADIQTELSAKGFIKNKNCEDGMAFKYRQKKKFLLSGPSLHIMVLTARCNNKCVYCHASAQSMEMKNVDMTQEIASKALDLIFKSPNKFIAIEFQGGEPLVNWEVLKFVVENATKRAKKMKKDLSLRLVSNFNLMTQDKFEYLIKNNVSLCTSLDGPASVHDKNRIALEGSSHKNVIFWIKKFRSSKALLKKYKYKKDIHAIPTFTKLSLNKYKEIIDEYVGLGLKEIFIKPVNPFGFSKLAWKKIGYSTQEFFEFYTKCLEYILELNKKGMDIKETSAGYYAQKILTPEDPNYLESRCPCGAGIGQLAYDYNGNVYTCDEGRMFSMMGDESFRLGTVKNSYRDLLDNATVKGMCGASCLIGAPGCNDCAYLPYCGTCPIYNHGEQGNIYGQMATNERCGLNKMTLDYIFKILQNKDKERVLRVWAIKSIKQ